MFTTKGNQMEQCCGMAITYFYTDLDYMLLHLVHE